MRTFLENLDILWEASNDREPDTTEVNNAYSMLKDAYITAVDERISKGDIAYAIEKVSHNQKNWRNQAGTLSELKKLLRI